MQPITVVEFIKPVSGKKQALKRALEEIVPVCRAHEGCLHYELLTPFSNGEGLLILMKWQNPADLKRHENSKVIQDFVAQFDGILYDSVTQTEWVSER